MAAKDPLLYSLATRLVPHRGRFDGDQRTPELLPGQLPHDLPVPLPFPRGVRLVGTLVDREYIEVVVDSEHSPGEVVRIYSGALMGTGWTELDPGRSRGGFEYANHAHGIFRFTHTGVDAALRINAHAYPGKATDVRLRLDLAPENQFSSEASSHPIPSLPELAAPAGATLRNIGGEASPLGTSTQAELITSLDLAAVAAHYAEQMRMAGCTQRDHGHGDLVAWSTWEVDDPNVGPSQGLFLALQQVNDPTHYFLYERVAWTPPT